MNDTNMKKRILNARLWNVVKFVPIAIVIIFGLMAISSTRDGGQTWVDGYASAFIGATYQNIRIRAYTQGQWKPIHTFNLAGAGDPRGVGLARALGSTTTLMGYGRGDNNIYLHLGIGFEFDREPVVVSGAKSAPAIAYIGPGSCDFMVAYKGPGDRVVLRPYGGSPCGLIQTDLAPSNAYYQNDHVRNRPAIAYHNGRLVIVWARESVPGTPYKFRFVAADYQAGDQALNLRATGDVLPDANAALSDPVLTHDGSRFVLGLIYFTGTTEIQSTFVSSNGETWERMSPQASPNLRGHNNLALAALPNGEILLATVSATGSESLVYRFRGGSWAPMDMRNVFGTTEYPYLSSFALVRHQYLD